MPVDPALKPVLRQGRKAQILRPNVENRGAIPGKNPEHQGENVMAHEPEVPPGSFNTSRRGFLGSTALAAIGAIIGGVLPLSATAAAFLPRRRKPAARPRPQHRRGRNT